ncbi:MAG: aminotransferase class III-fold pyridoxal phosphate-dependent enzyme [Armatimonadetes bacterium]|nr:aminotransferase class III-fold pyridoxal phosphate-dependent enzyme [Armatimonadota bacterium]
MAIILWNDAQINAVIENYQIYVNPWLASLMKFGGFGDVEMEAEGCIVRTASGEEYLDCLGGYGVFSLGHRHPKVIEAVKNQLNRMPLSSRTFFSQPQAELAARLAELAPGDLQYSFFCNSGTEAIEGAIKIARIATGKTNFICMVGGFHGKSMGGLSATGRDQYKTAFEPLVPGFTHISFNDVKEAAAAMDDRTAGIIVEPIQGEGGIRVPSPDYLPALREICDNCGALLIVDEVQTGLGRTGKLFAVEHRSVKPDMMTLAKALGGGVMPIGAVMGTPAIWERAFSENPLIHTSTFGGNPLACSAGLAALNVTIEEKLPVRAAEMGDRLMKGLRQVQTTHPDALVEVRGMGLMVGAEFAVKDVAELCINGMARRGVIAAYTLNNPKVIRFEPPLIITADQVDRVVSAFSESVAEAKEMLGL